MTLVEKLAQARKRGLGRMDSQRGRRAGRAGRVLVRPQGGRAGPDVLPPVPAALQRANGPDSRSSCSTGSGPRSWRPLFGWKRADGTRRYRRGYIEVPKKNGKSTLFSGLSLYLLVGDGEPGAEIYSAAVDRDQASIVFNEAANMVEASPHLSSRLAVIRSTKRIVVPPHPVVLQGAVGRRAGQGRAQCPCRADRRAARPEDPRAVGHAAVRRRLPPTAAAPGDHDGRLRPALDLLGAARLRREGARRDDPRPGVLRLHRGRRTGGRLDRPRGLAEGQSQLRDHDDAEQFAEDCREAQESPAKENSLPPLSAQPVDRAGRALDQHGEVGRLRRCTGRPGRPGVLRRPGSLQHDRPLGAGAGVPGRTTGTTCCPSSGCPRRGPGSGSGGTGCRTCQWIRRGATSRPRPARSIDYDRIRTQINELGKRYRHPGDRHRPLERHAAGHAAGRGRVRDGRLRAGLRQHELRRRRSWRRWCSPASWRTAATRCCAGWRATSSIETDAADNWKPSKKKSRERIDGIVALIMGLDRATTEPIGWYFEPGSLAL